jgi:hypothetical protein
MACSGTELLFFLLTYVEDLISPILHIFRTVRSVWPLPSDASDVKRHVSATRVYRGEGNRATGSKR